MFRSVHSLGYSLGAAMLLVGSGVASSGCNQTVVGGSIQQAQFKAGSAVAVVTATAPPGTASDGGAAMAGSQLTIAITTLGDTCGSFGGKKLPSGTQTLLLTVFDVDPMSGSPAAPKGPNTYMLYTDDGGPPAAAAQAAYFLNDGRCKSGGDQSATGVSGTVWISRAEAGEYDGGAGITFDDGDALAVDFHAAVCPAAAALAQAGGPPDGWSCP